MNVHFNGTECVCVGVSVCGVCWVCVVSCGRKKDWMQEEGRSCGGWRARTDSHFGQSDGQTNDSYYTYINKKRNLWCDEALRMTFWRHTCIYQMIFLYMFAYLYRCVLYCAVLCVVCSVLLYCIVIYCIFVCAFYYIFVFLSFFTKRLRIFDWCKLWYDSYGFWLRQQWFGSDACLLSSVSCSSLEPMGWMFVSWSFFERCTMNLERWYKQGEENRKE